MPWWGSNKPKPLETAEFHIIDDVKILPLILGSGSYGTVNAAVYNGKSCVAKEIHPCLTKVTKDNPAPLSTCIKEINTLSSLRHPSIVQFLGVYFRSNSHVPILIMERMWKSLSDVIEDQNIVLPMLIKARILYDLACGLQYLHSQKRPVVHRDLNANNVLLNDTMDAKIADLGQAKALVNIAGQQKLTTKPGHKAHMPPEALEHEPMYDTKLDIFSFGCTVIHLVTGNFPQPTEQYAQSDKGMFIKQPEVERRMEFISQMSTSSYYMFQQLAIQCLQDESSERPTASDICTDLEMKVQKLEEESPNLTKQYKQDKYCLVETLQSQNNELENAKILNENIQEEKETLKRQLSELATTHKNHRDQLKTELQERQNQIEVADTKIVDLQREVQNLRNKCESDAAVLSENNSKIANLENLMQEYSNTISVLRKENNTLMADKEDLVKANTDLKHEITEIKKKYMALQMASRRHQDEISYLRSDQRVKLMANTESNLHQILLELQHVNEKEHQQLQKQRQSQFDIINHKQTMVDNLTAQLSDMKKKFATQKKTIRGKILSFQYIRVFSQ